MQMSGVLLLRLTPLHLLSELAGCSRQSTSPKHAPQAPVRFSAFLRAARVPAQRA